MCIIHHAVILGPAQVLSSLQRPPCEFLKRRQHRVCSVVQALLSRKTLLKTRSLPQSLSSQGRTNPQGVRSQQPLADRSQALLPCLFHWAFFPCCWASGTATSGSGISTGPVSWVWSSNVFHYDWGTLTFTSEEGDLPRPMGCYCDLPFASKYCQPSTMYLLAVLTVCIGSDALMESIEFPWAHLML